MLRSPSLVLALAVALYSENVPAGPAELSARAAAAYRGGRINEARHLYEAALIQQPRHGSALAGLGRIDAVEHRRSQAEQNLALAYQSHPQDPTVVKEYAAAVADPGLETVLLHRLINLPATPADTRLYAQWRITLQENLAGRIVNQLRSPYQSYQLPMPVARADSFRPHGWFLRVSLNGRAPLRLLLDTGARSLLLGTKTAAGLGLEPLAESTVGGFGEGNRQRSRAMLASRLTIDGQLELAHVVVEVADQPFVDGIDGLISTDLFRHFLITCNGRRKTLELTPFVGHDATEGAGDRPWAGLAPPPLGPGFVPYRRLGHLLVLQDGLDESAQYVLDTGAGYTLIHEAVPSLNARSVSLVGASGGMVANRQEMPIQLNFNGLPRWTNEVLTTDLSDVSAYFGVRLAGFLGFPLWHNRELTLDPRNGSLRIGPEPTAQSLASTAPGRSFRAPPRRSAAAASLALTGRGRR